MLRHRNIDRICCAALALTLLVTMLFMGAAYSGAIAEDRTMGYETRLFDQSRVHTIDIIMDDTHLEGGWEAFLATATGEEYAACDLVIDGERFTGAAIRGKGNTSLSSVGSYGNDRYSFKVEFDHYQSGSSYYGLDKLSLNNLIYDNTYMKDYLAYTLMGRMGVAAPLCSFVQISVNGEVWGLYLAVEGVEESFLQRNYGKDYGELYKPDSMSFGGGRGNGGGFDMDEVMENFGWTDDAEEMATATGMPQMPEGFTLPEMPGMGDMTAATGMPQMPEGFTLPEMPGMGDMAAATGMPQMPEGFTLPSAGDFGGGFGGSMGSDDVKLVYTDDDPDSYSNIFNNAKTDVTEADQQRLIASLKALNAGDTAVIHQEAVLSYMAVHNFLCNEDSYTGTMVHNYYLYEEDGVLEMIPWDYNLAFGGFTGGTDATSTVNTGIDSLVSSGGGDRPMADWILADAAATEAYHAAYRRFIDETFTSGWFAAEYDRVAAMIAPYVQSDPTAFCTYDEFCTASQTLREFCIRRAESVDKQLNGEISATGSGRSASAGQVDASDLDLSAMGSMSGMGGFGGQGGGRGDNRTGGRTRGGASSGGETQPTEEASTAETVPTLPAGMPEGMQVPAEGQFPAGLQQPTDGQFPAGLQQPQGVTQDGGEAAAEPDATAAAPQEAGGKGSRGGSGRGEGWAEQDFGASLMPSGTSQTESWLLLAVSVGVLLAGLLFAALFRAKR